MVTDPPCAPAFSGGVTVLVSHAAELGGAELGLLDLARHLGPQRCRAVLLAGGDLQRMLERQGIEVKVIMAGSALMGVRRAGSAARALAAVPQTIALACKLAAAARRHELIYANSQKAALVAMLAGLLARRPVIWHLHDILDAGHFGWLQRHALAVLSNALTRCVIVVSAAARDAFVASGGRRARARLVYNGIDPRPYDGLDRVARTSLRDELGLKRGPLVGLFGRITEWKGQRVLIEALPLLPQVHALIVGAPMFGQDAELDHLKTLAARLGVTDRVTFLGQRPDVPRLMRAVDLVVHCSTSAEPFGRVIVEALLAGTPVLAAEGGASREILGESAWVVKAGDPAALAAAIDRVLALGDAEDVARLRARACEKFLLDRMLASVDGVIAEALSAGAGPKVFLLLFLQKKKALLAYFRGAARRFP